MPSMPTRSRTRSACCGGYPAAQAEAIVGGTEPDDRVDPRSLTPVTRSALKQAFREITHAQRRLMNEVGIRT